jgi:hypothetical protein
LRVEAESVHNSDKSEQGKLSHILAQLSIRST